MAQGHGKRPDGKAIELPSEKLQRQQIENKLDARAQEAQKALEKAQGGKEVDAEAAAQLQRGLGNSAVASMIKQGSDTDTATTAAEATLDESREEEVEEEKEDKDAGEVEHVLPSFSTGGGGGGPGGSPWAVGKFFGGDGDDDGDIVPIGSPRWRPMPLPPDPDEDVELLEIEDEQASEAIDASLDAAAARLGDAPWSAGTLSRGLRYAGRLAGRGVMGDDGEPDPVWSRARAILRFLGTHAPEAEARALAMIGAEIGVGESESLVQAVARELAIVERVLSRHDVSWMAIADVAGDQRARARVEQAASKLAATSQLGAPSLLAEALGDVVEMAEVDLVAPPHPAALLALRGAAHLVPMAGLEGWTPPGLPAAEDEALAMVDRLLAGDGADTTEGLPGVDALYDRMNTLLAAIGVAQVEGAAAALAAWPWLADGVAERVVHDLDAGLREAAQRLVDVGQRIEAAATAHDVATVEALSAAASGLAPLVARVRDEAVGTLAALLAADGAAAEAPLLPEVAALFARGRSRAARDALAGGRTLAHAAWAA
ncbi:MAG: hypothetical protein FJ102_24685, partial [Deltaproteobacteria bacterium]|nr:hypothetical protein [Deltaproteobacteria bacterium]